MAYDAEVLQWTARPEIPQLPLPLEQHLPLKQNVLLPAEEKRFQ